MRRASGDKAGGSTTGFLANLSEEQQPVGKPALISLAPPPSQVLFCCITLYLAELHKIFAKLRSPSVRTTTIA